jgi:hypothetical protein
MSASHGHAQNKRGSKRWHAYCAECAATRERVARLPIPARLPFGLGDTEYGVLTT